MWNSIKNAVLTAEQELAKDQIIGLEKRMNRCFDEDALFDMYCEACDIWDNYFETFELMDNSGRVPDHERIFLKRDKMLKEFSPALIVINGDVHVGGDVYINGQKLR